MASSEIADAAGNTLGIFPEFDDAKSEWRLRYKRGQRGLVILETDDDGNVGCHDPEGGQAIDPRDMLAKRRKQPKRAAGRPRRGSP